MAIYETTEKFFNKTVVAYEPGKSVDLSQQVVYRIALDYDDTRNMPDVIEEFLALVDKSQLDALIIGAWGDPYESGAGDILEALIARAADLPNLRALFIGDMTSEECEISWINQADYTGLLNAFPQLEVLRIRGSTELELEPVQHPNLRELTIECGGLPSKIVNALADSTLPKLSRLELWLGTDDYGFDGDVAVYHHLIEKLRTPALTYLGLRDSKIADELAQWLAGEAWIAQLHTLDLSLGTLGDIGAEALVNSAYVPALKVLNLSHHYISEAWQEKLGALAPQVLLDDAQEDDEDDGESYRYIAVSE